MEKDVDFLKLNSKNKNTEHATRAWIRNYKNWAKCNKEEEFIEKLAVEQLNGVLERYFASVKKRMVGNMNHHHS